MKFKSIIDVIQYFSDEQRCLDYLIQMRWKGEIICPHCGCNKIYELKGKFKRYKCTDKECKKQFSATKGTIFENSQIPLQKWFTAIFLYGFHKKGISSCQLAKDIDVTQKTAWFMAQRIRHMLNTGGSVELEGTIELDETFVGGKNKNRPYHKKVKNSQGRAFIDKTPVMGMLQKEEAHTILRPHKIIPGKLVKEKVVTKPSELKAIAISDTSGKSLHPHILETVKKGSIIISDEWRGYRGLNATYEHHIVDHTRGQYVDEAGHTSNTLEGAWSHLKRTIIGTYHQVSRKHLQRYVDEFVYRYNTRKITVQEILDNSMENINSRLTYKQLVKKKAA